MQGQPVYAETPCGQCLNRGIDCTGLPLGRCDACKASHRRCSRTIDRRYRHQKGDYMRIFHLCNSSQCHLGLSKTLNFGIITSLISQISRVPEDIKHLIACPIRGIDLPIDILPASLRPQISESDPDSDTSIVRLGWVEFKAIDVPPMAELGRPGDIWICSYRENSVNPSSEVIYVCEEVDEEGSSRWSPVLSEQVHDLTTNNALRHPLVPHCVFGRSDKLRYCWILDEVNEAGISLCPLDIPAMSTDIFVFFLLRFAFRTRHRT